MTSLSSNENNLAQSDSSADYQFGDSTSRDDYSNRSIFFNDTSGMGTFAYDPSQINLWAPDSRTMSDESAFQLNTGPSNKNNPNYPLGRDEQFLGANTSNVSIQICFICLILTFFLYSLVWVHSTTPSNRV